MSFSRRYHVLPASNIKRVLAYFIDTLPIQMLLYVICSKGYGISPFHDPYAPPGDQHDTAIARSIITLGTFTLWVAYCIIGELSPLRGTFGKYAMGIAVQSLRGHRLTVGQIIGRNTAKILSAIPCQLGFLAAFVTNQKRTWHDMLSGVAVAELLRKVSAFCLPGGRLPTTHERE